MKQQVKSMAVMVLVFVMSTTLQAKKVKFAVNMTGQIISPNGVHVVGDFQALAGLGPDWDPAKIPLMKEGNTTIYSAVVNVPAFRKYEYRFVNGDQTYEAEFVPELSRVGYDLVDNRWLYVDSLTNDTSTTGAILFGGNAPSGQYLIRYKVNTNRLGVLPAKGFHVAASYQNFDPSGIRLYSFGHGIYEIISYAPAGTYGYKFYNGNTAAVAEVVPGSCAVNGNRNLVLSKDTALAEVCFAECTACTDVGLAEFRQEADLLQFYPNPASGKVKLKTANTEGLKVTVSDYSGRIVAVVDAYAADSDIDLSHLGTGIYLITATTARGDNQHGRLLLNH